MRKGALNPFLGKYNCKHWKQVYHHKQSRFLNCVVSCDLWCGALCGSSCRRASPTKKNALSVGRSVGKVFRTSSVYVCVCVWVGFRLWKMCNDKQCNPNAVSVWLCEFVNVWKCVKMYRITRSRSSLLRPYMVKKKDQLSGVVCHCLAHIYIVSIGHWVEFPSKSGSDFVNNPIYELKLVFFSILLLFTIHDVLYARSMAHKCIYVRHRRRSLRKCWWFIAHWLVGDSTNSCLGFWVLVLAKHIWFPRVVEKSRRLGTLKCSNVRLYVIGRLLVVDCANTICIFLSMHSTDSNAHERFRNVCSDHEDCLFAYRIFDHIMHFFCFHFFFRANCFE